MYYAILSAEDARALGQWLSVTQHSARIGIDSDGAKVSIDQGTWTPGYGVSYGRDAVPMASAESEARELVRLCGGDVDYAYDLLVAWLRGSAGVVPQPISDWLNTHASNDHRADELVTVLADLRPEEELR